MNNPYRNSFSDQPRITASVPLRAPVAGKPAPTDAQSRTAIDIPKLTQQQANLYVGTARTPYHSGASHIIKVADPSKDPEAQTQVDGTTSNLLQSTNRPLKATDSTDAPVALKLAGIKYQQITEKTVTIPVFMPGIIINAKSPRDSVTFVFPKKAVDGSTVCIYLMQDVANVAFTNSNVPTSKKENKVLANTALTFFYNEATKKWLKLI